MSSSASSRASEPAFLTHHALRIKGFARVETLAEMIEFDHDLVAGHLQSMAEAEWAMFREARSLWQLTPQGREAHGDALATDLQGVDLGALVPHYQTFLDLNGHFKQLCGDWQLRDGEINDHSDSKYDSKVIDRLAALDAEARPVVASMSEVLGRLRSYVPRLESTCRLVREGRHDLFTGVMCGSFHDVWMELHEDLILSQGIDRAAEGSF